MLAPDLLPHPHQTSPARQVYTLLWAWLLPVAVVKLHAVGWVEGP